VIASSPSSW